jgi:probable F420-dependent oxidoreductase
VKIRFAVAPAGSRQSEGDFEEMLEGLEAGSFDGIWLSDVTLAPAIDPLVGLAFAAARTKRLKLGANVVPLGHNPFLLAKELAQIDRLSGCRLLLTFVPGIGQPKEKEALGFASRDRGRALEDALGLVRSFWAGEPVRASSAQWYFDEVVLHPPHTGHLIEVWLGGNGPKALDRAGRISDGWLGAALSPTEALDARRAIDDAASRAGRVIDPEHFGMSIPYARRTPEAASLAVLSARRPGRDPLEIVGVGQKGLRSLVTSYIEAGLSKFVLRPLEPEPWGAELEWLSESVLELQS